MKQIPKAEFKKAEQFLRKQIESNRDDPYKETNPIDYSQGWRQSFRWTPEQIQMFFESMAKKGFVKPHIYGTGWQAI